MKKMRLVSPNIYHLFNRSIAKFRIFNNEHNIRRFLEIVDYYNKTLISVSFSKAKEKSAYKYHDVIYPHPESVVKYLAYCIMPTHYHFLVKVVDDEKISQYISNIENAYTRFFNIKNNRKGPLWESRFKAVMIKDDSQLIHVHRYIHLNPSTLGLVDMPEEWEFSSYKNFIRDNSIYPLMNELSIDNRRRYRQFVEDNKDYQKTLHLIKKVVFE